MESAKEQAATSECDKGPWTQQELPTAQDVHHHCNSSTATSGHLLPPRHLPPFSIYHHLPWSFTHHLPPTVRYHLLLLTSIYHRLSSTILPCDKANTHHRTLPLTTTVIDFVQQIFIIYLLNTEPGPRHWTYSHETNMDPIPKKTPVQERKEDPDRNHNKNGRQCKCRKEGRAGHFSGKPPGGGEEEERARELGR